MPDAKLQCSECGAIWNEGPDLLTCPQCSTRQMPGAPLCGVLEIMCTDLPHRWPQAPLGSPDWLENFLPVLGADLPPLPVGGTPLLPADRLRDHLTMPRLWLKDDTRNPSGSTKDRASQLVVAKAHEFALSTVATASTGNAATALAAVAAASGIQAVVLVPAAAPRAKLVQMASYGARLIPVDGTYDDAFELCCTACNQLGWYNRNTAQNPYTIEGKKTAALEIAAQMAPETPDVVMVPTGDGVILAGIAKGFADLFEAGLIDQIPRLIAVQPEGSSAIATALRSEANEITPVLGASSVADSLTVEAPRNARLCLKRVRESQGAGVIVSDDEIITAIGRLASLTGVFAEPAAAATLAGLETALEERLVDRSERTVLLITGTGLKDVPAAARGITMPDRVTPTLEAVVRVVEGGAVEGTADQGRTLPTDVHQLGS